MRFLIFITLSISLIPVAMAQTGAISGIIRNEAKVAEFVNVVIEGTRLGTSTNEEGRFRIENVPIGTKKLKISGIGYQNQVVVVEVKQGATNSIDIALKEDVAQLEAVVVTGTMKEVTIWVTC